MSKTTDMASEEGVALLSKKERREKKEKKEKKRAKLEAKAEASDSDAGEDAVETPAKKRKRDALPDEIEIDVALPEPASKKAARKAKKAKLNPTTTVDKDGNTVEVKAPETKDDKDASAKRSDFGVWIGNLPWSATKELLRNFLTEHTDISSEQITRIHLPAPTKPANPNWTNKPLNRGFAYVDFTTELAMYSAIALTETKMDGRALLIKNAKSFEGRPDKPKPTEDQDTGRGAKGAVKGAHPPNKRVFIGNLSFDATKEDLEAHYGQCGTVEHIHMATFEDSGKCKGYAWVTFGDVDAATSAVKGFVWKNESDIKGKKKDKEESDDEEDARKVSKKRKWLITKLFGRDLRCEFAEDSTTRYNKRYGKDKPAEPVEGVNPARWGNFNKDGEQRGGKTDGEQRGGKKDARDFKPRGKVDARTIKSGSAHMNAPRASQAIVESQGKKTTFE